MRCDVRLSHLRDGKLVREPVCLTIVGLRETLLVASDFNEAKVNHICKTLEEMGVCRMESGDGTDVFEISKILQS